MDQHQRDLESAFLVATDTSAYDLAARLAGYLERFRAQHAHPRTPSLAVSFGERMNVLQKAFLPPQLEALMQQGSVARATVLEDEIDRLGD